jgi:hypothetical protein
MASWSSVVLLSGFDYDGQHAAIRALPPGFSGSFRSFWSNGTGWGVFAYTSGGGAVRFELKVITGTLSCHSCEIHSTGRTTEASLSGRHLDHSQEASADTTTFRFKDRVGLHEGDVLQLELRT